MLTKGNFISLTQTQQSVDWGKR